MNKGLPIYLACFALLVSGLGQVYLFYRLDGLVVGRTPAGFHLCDADALRAELSAALGVDLPAYRDGDYYKAKVEKWEREHGEWVPESCVIE